MVGKNQALLTEKAEMKRKAQVADQTEQELARKSQVFQKTIKNLVHLPCLRDQACLSEQSCISASRGQQAFQRLCYVACLQDNLQSCLYMRASRLA